MIPSVALSLSLSCAWFSPVPPEEASPEEASPEADGGALDWAPQATWTPDVKLRASPDTQGDLVAELPIRTPVTLRAVGEPQALFGLERPWVQVETPEGSGWVWSGLLTGLSAEAGDGHYVIGLRGLRHGDKDFVSVEVGGTHAGRPLAPARADLWVPDDWPALRPEQIFRVRVSGDLGYPGLDELVQLDFSEDSCGGRSGNLAFARSGTQVVFLREITEGFDSPCASEERLIFPAQAGGRPGAILLHQYASCYDDSDEEDVMQDETTALRWADGALRPL